MVALLDSTGFISDLKTEKVTFEAFIEILKKEEQALVQGEIKKIDDLASDKSLLVEKLIRLDNHRNKNLKNHGVSLDKHDVNNWFTQQYSDKPKMRILWNELLKLVEVAQKLNYSNGLIISVHLQHNQQAFAALHCAAGSISLYGPKGQAYI